MDNSIRDILRLKNQLCFPLYAASRQTIKLYTPYLDELGLTYTQYITMELLWERRTMTVKELGEELFLDSGTLTPLLKKLEAKGYITRARSCLDERHLIVSVTEEGDALSCEAQRIFFGKGPCEHLTVEESAMLHHLLYKLLGRPEAPTPDWARK